MQIRVGKKRTYFIKLGKRLIDSFINCIYLYDDKMVIAFNYKDGTKTVSFEELEEELSSDLECLPQPFQPGYE